MWHGLLFWEVMNQSPLALAVAQQNSERRHCLAASGFLTAQTGLDWGFINLKTQDGPLPGKLPSGVKE